MLVPTLANLSSNVDISLTVTYSPVKSVHTQNTAISKTLFKFSGSCYVKMPILLGIITSKNGQKIHCLVFEGTFENDCCKDHNLKYHQDIVLE